LEVGTEINKIKALKSYKIAAKKGSLNAELFFGIYNDASSFIYYRKAAKKACLNANIAAQKDTLSCLMT
jgi:hypothetical protein